MNVTPRPKAGVLRSPALYKQARRQVIARSQGWCEVDGCTAQGVQAHHVRRRSQGGSDTAANLRWVCTAHHDWIHANPAEAVVAGLLAVATVEPMTSAVQGVYPATELYDQDAR